MQFGVFWDCDQSPLGTQLGIKIQPLTVSSGPKTDSPNAVINPLFPDVHYKVTYLNKRVTESYRFKYVWPFSGHQALKY